MKKLSGDRWRGSPSNEHGFSLIELIVVIGIIAILAAVVTPSFLGIQSAVREAATRSDLGNNRTALVAYGIDNNGVVPAATGFDPGPSNLNLIGYGWSQSADTSSYRYLTDSGRTAWCLEMTSGTGTVYRVSTNKPVLAGTCAALGVLNY